MSAPVSTGRGGAGNIGDDPNTYVDGDIIREGTAEQQGAGYRGGRGGAGNTALGSSGIPAEGGAGTQAGKSEDIIPESAMRTGEGHENFHTGRGGQGNVHRAEFGGHSHPQKDGKAESLLDKAKHAIGLDKKDKSEA